jgi:glycosyltransferase involved in cell wall biosynthesis
MPNQTSPPKKVIHLTSVHQPFDTRIFYKECVSLAQAGYDVVLIAPYDHSKTRLGVHIQAVSRPSGRKQRIRRPIWQVYRAALAENGDLYHFHDPELIPVGLLLKLHGKNVVYDVHEDTPVQIRNKAYLAPWMRFLASNAMRFANFIAGHVLDGIIGAIPEITAQFPESKAITLHNYPSLQLIDRAQTADAPRSAGAVIIYAGGLRPIRGICELINAVDQMDHPAELWLLGPWISEEFEEKCRQLPGWEKVRYLGMVDPNQVYGYLKLADIGLATLHPRRNYLISLPVKAFEYMACSLPVVMSDFPYWRQRFGGAARFIDPQDPDAIAAAITDLIEHPDKAETMGQTGRRMVEETYSWEAEAPKLLTLYDRILSH